jgi:RNA polymerase sigma-70 factor (ECF subfamily)
MTAIVRNKAFDALRRHKDTVEIDAAGFDLDIIDTSDAGRTPTQHLEQQTDAQALAGCMAGLQGLHRQAIALAFYRDFSHSEVAAQLQLPVGTVKTWIRRGLERLRRCLAGQAAA